MSETSESKTHTTENVVDKIQISQEIEAKLKESVALLIPINRKEERRNTLSALPVPEPFIPEQNMKCDF